MVNKNVLSCLLKDGKEVNAVMLVVRLFHARATVTRNDRSPMVLSLVRGTIRRGHGNRTVVDAVIPPRQSNGAHQRDTKAPCGYDSLITKDRMGVVPTLEANDYAACSLAFSGLRNRVIGRTSKGYISQWKKLQ